MNDQEIEGLKNKIAELEKEIARLRASPPVVYHYHYGTPYCQPCYLPQPPWAPQYPQITYGGPQFGTVAVGAVVG